MTKASELAGLIGQEVGLSKWIEIDQARINDLTVYYNVGRALADSRDWPEWKSGSEFGPARAASAAERKAD